MSSCPACDGTVWREFLVAADMYRNRPYAILRCDHCGLAKTAGGDAALPDDSYEYGGSCDAGRRFGAMQWMLRAFRRGRLGKIAAGRPGRALDVGCGDGSFLQALSQQGWDVSGTELTDSIAATARACFGKRIRVGAIHRIGLPAGSFDLVTFWHVLEHLDDPRLALVEARRLVNKDGRIVVAVPNIESWQAQLFKEQWLHLDVPRHRWHFSPRTLAALADRCDLRVERTSHFSLEYGPFAVMQGIASRAGLGHTLFTSLIRESPLRLLRQPLFWVHVPLLAVSAVPSLLFELTAACCGCGGAVEMVFKPR